jgi:DNA-binding protein HU-beta
MIEPIDPKIANLNLSFKRRISKSRTLTEDVELVGIFQQFGLNLLEYKIPREEIFAMVPKVMQGRKPEIISQQALEFLVNEFDAEVVQDSNGRTVLNFPQEKPKGDEMNVLSEVAERSGQKRSLVKEVYEALLKTIRITLKNERRIRLPDFAVVKVQYRPAKEKRKGRNPWTGKPMTFKAKAASNKLRITPIKFMKDWCNEKLEVVAPVKKKSKKKD